MSIHELPVTPDEVQRFTDACSAFGGTRIPEFCIGKDLDSEPEVFAISDENPFSRNKLRLNIAIATASAIGTQARSHIQTLVGYFDSHGQNGVTEEMEAFRSTLMEEGPDSFLVAYFESSTEEKKDNLALTIVKVAGKAALGTTTAYSATLSSKEGIERELSLSIYPDENGELKQGMIYSVRPPRNPILDEVMSFFIDREDAEGVAAVATTYIHVLTGTEEQVAEARQAADNLDDEASTQLKRVIELAMQNKTATQANLPLAALTTPDDHILQEFTQAILAHSNSPLN